MLHAAAALESLPDDGSRHNYVREVLHLPYTTYLQRLDRLLSDPAALVEAPLLVLRLRQRQRAAQVRRGHTTTYPASREGATP